MVVVNPNLLKEIKNHSTKNFNISSCFNCGTCTAICPLSTEENQFPRSMIRYGQLGMKEKILAEKKIWICSACNDCSESCPKNATPGEYMNALRKWTISQYDVTGISKFLFKNKWNFKIFTLVVALSLAFFFYVTSNLSGISNARPIRLFDVISYENIRDSSIIIFSIIALIVMLSLMNQVVNILHFENNDIKQGIKEARQEKNKVSLYSLLFSPVLMIKEAIKVGFLEVFGQKKQLECLEEKSSSKLSILTSKWLMHIFTIWGFVGLLCATILDMLLKTDHNELVSVLYPIRLLGITSGIFFLIGISAFILKRVFKVNKYYSNSTYEDYFILVTLWIIGFTGVLLTAILYITAIPASLAFYIFAIHLIAFYELMVFAPFTKFAHVWSRTIAMWIYYGLDAKKRIVQAL